MVRKLAIIFGDQLNLDSSLFSNLDPKQDMIFMAEVLEESIHVPSHKARIVLFLSAMRHFYNKLKSKYQMVYYSLSDEKQMTTFEEALGVAIKKYKPESLVMVLPGEYRVLSKVRDVSKNHGLHLDVLDDEHFLSSIDEFKAFMKGKKSIVQEFFYRHLRKKTGYLMEAYKPVGGSWNFDKQNRASFDAFGPKTTQQFQGHKPDKVTKEVIDLVELLFPENPGNLTEFAYAVNHNQALETCRYFIDINLNEFGPYQDALWTDHPFLYHSQLASSLNLKLISPKQVIEMVLDAFHERDLNLASVEGFIRQILGWREFIRGIYWTHMPEYKMMNFLDAQQPLPSFFWTGNTDMLCMKQAITQTLEYGYAHHIQRLMVTGLFSLMYGVNPVAIHEWYLSVYVDAVEWVELPNTIGMSQFADGGIVGTKPYVATGKYIDRMSNYCKKCPYDPKIRLGDKACPFTVFYWDFLLRHRDLLKDNQRLALQLRNCDRISEEEKSAIHQQATQLRDKYKT